MSQKVIEQSLITEAHDKGYQIIWKLGTKDHPASSEEIAEFQTLLSQAIANKLDIVYGHDLEIIIYDPNTKHVVEGVKC
jgi:hypothetical protein